MPPQSAPDIKSIFGRALELDDANRREAYLNEVCADAPAMRHEVQELLAMHENADGFLRQPVVPGCYTTAGYEPVSEQPGTHVGPYKLLQQIGEGGMGVVYMAEQEQPVRRKVAIKIIKPGLDTKQVVARFEAERQALAMMDHCNIAKVFDAGTTESGRPYFVMELVHGVPIVEYCDANRLTPRSRLELFIPVCQAIQHAHQNGIIHRDIKPSNVLVTVCDDRPVPKVIDFGVAKAVEQRLTQKTLFTQFGTVVGTFEYMSPEQAEMNAYGVDTRSDVYSLGVLLYELLTGTTPLERDRLREAAYAEIVRWIKEEEPPRPSVRLSSSGALAKVAAARKTEPTRLPALVSGDLDWIVMKALDKDRSRRYETVSALAADVDRFLTEMPVEARPPSTWYRVRKLARRNKVALATSAIVVVSLLLGTAISIWQAARASEERDRAIAAEAKANRDKETAQAALSFLWQDLPSQVSPLIGSSRDLTVYDLLDRLTARLDQGSGMPQIVEASIRQMVGRLYVDIGDNLKAREHLEWALAVQRRELGEENPQTLATMHILAVCLLRTAGPFNETAREAMRLFDRTLELRRRVLGDDHRDTLATMHMAAVCLQLQGPSTNGRSRMEPALELLKEAASRSARAHGDEDRQTIHVMANLGYVLAQNGQLAEAEELLTRSVNIAKGLGDGDPLLVVVTEKLFFTYLLGNDLARAEPLGERALAGYSRMLGDNHFVTAWVLVNLIRVYQMQERWVDAAPLVDRLLKTDVSQRILGLEFRGRQLLAEGKYVESEAFLRQLLDGQTAARPGSEESFRAQCVLGASLIGQKRYVEAEPLILQGYTDMRKWWNDQGEPETPFRMLFEVEAVGWLVQLYDGWEKPEEAEKWRRELISLRARLPASRGPGAG
jgi:serine/threonine protein kinase